MQHVFILCAYMFTGAFLYACTSAKMHLCTTVNETVLKFFAHDIGLYNILQSTSQLQANYKLTTSPVQNNYSLQYLQFQAFPVLCFWESVMQENTCI